jgi:hypothetical protein
MAIPTAGSPGAPERLPRGCDSIASDVGSWGSLDLVGSAVDKVDESLLRDWLMVRDQGADRHHFPLDRFEPRPLRIQQTNLLARLQLAPQQLLDRRRRERAKDSRFNEDDDRESRSSEDVENCHERESGERTSASEACPAGRDGNARRAQRSGPCPLRNHRGFAR